LRGDVLVIAKDAIERVFALRQLSPQI
jgi:hypothetical protein